MGEIAVKEINFFARKTMKGFPKLRKTGAIAGSGECTPFVWRGKLMLLENHWGGFGGTKGPCAVAHDYFTHDPTAPVGGDGCRFFSAFCEDDRVHVFGTLENRVWHYVSEDLREWRKTPALEMPETFELFNTSVCRGGGKYVMALECAWKGQSEGKPNTVGNPYIGAYYTEFFAQSPDLKSWEALPFENCYTKERYNACPALRFCEGWYYMICLEELPCTRYAPYLYRTQDFETWEIGLYNPILMPGEEDRRVKPGAPIPEDVAALNATHVDINNSDVDLCEFEGKTYFVYCSGNQGTTGAFNGMTCEAVYDGPMDEYFRANFE